MASLYKRNGSYYIRYYSADGKRQAIGLRTKSESRAIVDRTRIENLVSSSKTGRPLDAETEFWLSRQKETLLKKLASHGLIEPSKASGHRTLGQHLEDFFTRRSDVKESTRTNWSHTRRNLLEFFGADKPISSITAGEAQDFERYLKTTARQNRYCKADVDDGLSADTVRKRISNAKLFSTMPSITNGFPVTHSAG